ncbi:toprim domain-containing protein, partial [Acinetobacter baumannii]|uniref:toprim domain-containing protein n=1 Tax=Acinetobacter baumannii TaxID=470 RepID=UPI003316BA33
QLLAPLSEALSIAADRVKTCGVCGSLDTQDPCAICADPQRDPTLICVVEEVGALWAMERAAAFKGRYHVLGGLLSALDGIGPEALRIGPLV